MRIHTKKALLISIACLLAAAPALADVLAQIDDLEPGALEVRGFELDAAQDVEIEAVGFDREDDDERDRHGWGAWGRDLTEAWILDSRTREVVWSMNAAGRYTTHRFTREYDDTVRLDAGTYEVYYATHPDRRSDGDDSWWERIGRRMSQGGDWSDFERAMDDYRIAVQSRGRALEARSLEDARMRMSADALVTLNGLGDGESASRGFELDRPLEVEVYAVGEVADGGGYDYGWILDADSRERVWTFDRSRSDAGGGAAKNRVARATLELAAGRYAAFFMTDDSHSPERWNALPPHDPAYWGLTVRVAEPDGRQDARAFDYRHFPGEDQVIVEITRMDDYDYRSEGFTISRPLDVRVYALGEGSGDEMHDYGWITNARTRAKVWSMDVRGTEHAGGAQKNRMVDEVIRLEPGSYMVSFVTDGSHSYRDWNASPPFYPRRWGISLFAAGEGFDRSQVAEYVREEDPSVLARIDRARDRDRREVEFSLDEASRVSIYALGEGANGRMYDYGWIEDDRGRVVWEMDYRSTDPAGGADKNRLYEGDVMLEAGDYVLRYETDGSHSFGGWNAAPPRDPEGWGIQIARSD